MKISAYAINHPAVIAICLAALALGSFIAASSLKQQLFANVDLPQAFVITTWPGGSPEDVEREITNPLEDELSQLSGLSSVKSTSSDSLSFINLSFTMETLVEDKLVEIREKINNAAGDLPDDISGPPRVWKMSSSSLSAFTAVLENPLSITALTEFADEKLMDRFSRIDGVAQVSLGGETRQEIFIELDLDRLYAAGITPLEVLELLKAGNSSLPAGSVTMEQRSMNIRTAGRFSSTGELEMLVVGARGGSPIRLRDVARVSLEPAARNSRVVSRGKDILSLNFDLLQGADATETIALIKKEMARMVSDYDGLITFFVLSDDSETIELSLSSVINSAMMGGLLAVLILFLFLHNIRTTTIISLSIPFSLMMALAAMKLTGMSLNIMTLGGLTVAIGMIVDSSIVILENIYRHYRDSDDKRAAALIGSEEMGRAVTASTITTLAVFLPLVFLKGMIGEILRDISLTMAFALLASLFAALIVVPFLSSRILKPHPKAGEAPPKLEKTFSFVERSLNRLTELYAGFLKTALHRRTYVIYLALSLLALSLLLTRFLGFEFVPSTDMNEIIISCEYPPSYSLDDSVEKTERLEREIYSLLPEAVSTAFNVGGGGSFDSGNSANRASGSIQLSRRGSRNRSARELINLLQEELPRRIPDINVTVKNGGFDEMLDFSTGGIGMVIDLYGSDMDALLTASAMVEEVMARDPNVKKAGRSINLNGRELIIDEDHSLMGPLGVTAVAAGLTSRLVFNGLEAGEMEQDGVNRTIRLSTAYEEDPVDSRILSRIKIRNFSGQIVPLSAFATLRKEPAVSSIRHMDGMTTIKVTGQLYESNIRDTRDRVTSLLEKKEFPSGVEWEVGGSSAEMSSSFSSMFLIMAAAVFLVYMVMVIQFERFLQPLVIMASVPFTLIGVVLGLLIFRSTLNVVSLLGMIALAGIVVNNAIVLIDYTNLLRSRGMALDEAIIKGGQSRLKPIIMTTLTTILGLFPIALGLGEGGEMLSSLGQAISGGLITSTLITLVLIPVLYSLLEEGLERRSSNKGDSHEN